MHTCSHRILLVDETSFLRVCSLILEREGFTVDTVNAGEDNWTSKLNLRDVALVIFSYPYGRFICEEVRKFTLPVLVLSDHISEDIIHLLEEFKKSYCMIKPLDYGKFTSLVKKLMNGDYPPYAGYKVL